MAKDDRDILEVLKQELNFLKKGGYRPSVQVAGQPQSALQDSLTCVNYGYPYRAHPCNECHLLDFVRPEHHNEWIPCHFIPLNERGETINSLELDGNETKLNRALEEWIRARIHDIEEERSQQAMAGCP